MTTNVVETAVRRSVVAIIVVCLVASVALWLRPPSVQPTATRNDALAATTTPRSSGAAPSQVSTPAGRGGVISVPLVTGSTGAIVSSGPAGTVTSAPGRRRGHSGGRSNGGAGAGNDPAPARVTGLSLLLDYINNTSGLGFPTVYKLGTSTVFAVVPVQDLPKAGQNELFKVVNLPTSAYDTFSSNGPATIAFARKMFAPLSTFNGPSNALVGIIAKTLDQLGTKYAGITGPFNQTLVGFATLIQAAKAPVPG